MDAPADTPDPGRSRPVAHARVPPCLQHACADPPYSDWGLAEYAAKFTCDGRVGYGMFECAVIGAHEQYGFNG
jgi:hypothetical protein